MAKMGRPPVDDDKRRDKMARATVTADELAELQAAADAAGETLSNWSRDTLLKAARASRKPSGRK